MVFSKGMFSVKHFCLKKSYVVPVEFCGDHVTVTVELGLDTFVFFVLPD